MKINIYTTDKIIKLRILKFNNFKSIYYEKTNKTHFICVIALLNNIKYIYIYI